MKHGEPENGTIALLRLIKINIDGNSLHEAKQQLQAAANFLENSKNDELSISSDYYDLKSQLYEKLGLAAESIIYRKKYEQDKDSLIKRNNIAAVERVKLRYEIDKHNDEVTQLKTDAKIQSVKIKAAVVVLVLLMGISLLLYYNQRLKSKKDKELLLAEKRRMDEELRNAETALNNFTENLRQKNMLIEKFKSEVENLKLLSANNANAGRLEELLQAHIMTDESWQDFRKLFSQVYPGFFVNLSRDQPLLSSADIRMLALIKLGLSNSEMAGMLGITVDGIQKAKQRLRKKMDVNAVTRVGDDLEMG
jgi:DNA-binding CsgD family transcriptional regulator